MELFTGDCKTLLPRYTGSIAEQSHALYRPQEDMQEPKDPYPSPSRPGRVWSDCTRNAEGEEKAGEAPLRSDPKRKIGNGDDFGAQRGGIDKAAITQLSMRRILIKMISFQQAKAQSV